MECANHFYVMPKSYETTASISIKTTLACTLAFEAVINCDRWDRMGKNIGHLPELEAKVQQGITAYRTVINRNLFQVCERM